MAAYNDFDRQFAEFLNQAPDVLRFAALGTTEQGGLNTAFKVDYPNPSGAIAFYRPDWVIVQDTEIGELNWIVKTNGRVWEGTEQTDDALRNWCKLITLKTNNRWKYIRVNQSEFNPEAGTFRKLIVTIISKRMFTERDQRGTTMSSEEVRQARDEGRL